MTISFNNIPTSIRTPGVYTEIDNSRALKGLIQNPHRTLILGQKTYGDKVAAGTIPVEVLKAITNDNIADGFFGIDSPLAKMCRVFKDNNPHTELHAMALSASVAGAQASCDVEFSTAMNEAVASVAGTWHLMIAGHPVDLYISKGDSPEEVAIAFETMINSMDTLPIHASVSHYNAVSYGHVELEVTFSGTWGNEIDIRENYYEGQFTPSAFSATPQRESAAAAGGGSVLSFTDGANGLVGLDDAWAIIDGDQFHYIIQPYTADTHLTSIEDELTDRFNPLNNLQGHGFAVMKDTHAAITTQIDNRNVAFNTVMGVTGAPQMVEEWVAALGAVAAWNLNNDPARPLHYLYLKGLLPPAIADRYSRAERDIHLYDGAATHIINSAGRVLIERCITTYRSNSAGHADPSYLDIQTLATLGEIRYQYNARMSSRFIAPRFKLADDSFPVQPGSKVARAKDVKQETIALFTLLRNKGLIENLDDFIDNLIVERDLTDRNRVNCLLPADLINQFRVLATTIQFIL